MSFIPAVDSSRLNLEKTLFYSPQPTAPCILSRSHFDIVKENLSRRWKTGNVKFRYFEHFSEIKMNKKKKIFKQIERRKKRWKTVAHCTVNV